MQHVNRSRMWRLLVVVGLATSCAPVHQDALSRTYPTQAALDRAESVRIRGLVEDQQRVIIERTNGQRLLIQVGSGCEDLPAAVNDGSIPVAVESPSAFAGPGSKLLFPLHHQGCWIENATQLH